MNDLFIYFMLSELNYRLSLKFYNGIYHSTRMQKIPIITNYPIVTFDDIFSCKKLKVDLIIYFYKIVQFRSAQQDKNGLLI
ncbi:hypothetical protein pb186bvf_001814 [Paramecium bursaria]